MARFEAIGSGAFLVTERVPGLDRLFSEGHHYAVLSPDAAGQL